MIKIGIDPGHGGRDPGAIGPAGQKEKDIVLQIGLKLIELLDFNGFKTIPTRVDDVYMSLIDRSDLLNRAKVNLVISLHINSFTNPKPNYIASFIIAKGGLAEKAAQKIQQELQAATDWPSPAAKDGIIVKNLHMVRETIAPAIIIEMGFISNPKQAEQLKDPNFQAALARAIAKGICQHFNKKFKEPLKTNVSAEKIKAIIEGKEQDALLIDGKAYVHARTLTEMGIKISWDDKNKIVYLHKK